MQKNTITFLTERNYKYMREMGRGGLGRTILIQDEIIDEYFVCKKYQPIDEGNTQTYFRNFVDEIKILHLIYHKNIVRVFNYYLYPDKFTGYILMEYVNGDNIEEFVASNPTEVNNLFAQVIEAFKHLEDAQIMHRDIRPENIMVSENGTIKIIDFGFGKKIQFNEDDFDKSITLNWRYSTPSEFKESIYDFKTEIYFIGKLFGEMIESNSISSFLYSSVLKKMIVVKYENRINSFAEISREILSQNFRVSDFTSIEKKRYLAFANGLSLSISSIYQGAEYISDLEVVIEKLEDVYRSSALEEYVQNVPAIIWSFIKNKGYRFNSTYIFEVSVLKEFLAFFKILPAERQMVVLSNIWQRLDVIKRIEDPDDLPF